MVDIIYAFIQGLEKPLILWLVARGPMHGYEIITRMKQLTAHKPKPSVFYPMLHKLEHDGFLVGEWVKKGRRSVKYYRLTEKGREMLRRMRRVFSGPLRGILSEEARAFSR